MRQPARSIAASVFAIAIACAAARASDPGWVPSGNEGARIINVMYEAYAYGFGPTLRIGLENAGEYQLVADEWQDIKVLHQTLVQAEVDSLPVFIHVADSSARTFDKILIGEIDPDFPIAVRVPKATDRDRPASRLGFDLMGRARSLAASRTLLLARPTPMR